MKDLVWTEKYRPKNLDDYICSDSRKEKIRNLIKNPKSMPSFLFYSKSPGTGKTSLAYVIKKEIGCSNSDFLILNSSDERKIETIRGTVKDFAMTLSTKKGIPRIVLLDEFDGMLSSSQEALRFIMERYSSNCKFIFTANDITKVIEPIVSRCTPIEIRETPKEKIKEKLNQIMNEENINKIGDTPKAITKLIDIYYPDMRSMINKIQELAPDITPEKIKAPQTLELEVWKLLKERDPFEARRFFLQNGMNGRDLLKYLWQKMLKDDELKQFDGYKDRLKEVLWYAAEIEYRMRIGADEDIQLLSWMLKFLHIWR